MCSIWDNLGFNLADTLTFCAKRRFEGLTAGNGLWEIAFGFDVIKSSYRAANQQARACEWMIQVSVNNFQYLKQTWMHLFFKNNRFILFYYAVFINRLDKYHLGVRFNFVVEAPVIRLEPVMVGTLKKGVSGL